MPIDRTSSSAVNPFQDKSASFSRRVFRYTGPSSYATGGELIGGAAPSTNVLGLGAVARVSGTLWNGTNSLLVVWDATNGKVILVTPSTNVEVVNGTDVSAYAGVLEAIGN